MVGNHTQRLPVQVFRLCVPGSAPVARKQRAAVAQCVCMQRGDPERTRVHALCFGQKRLLLPIGSFVAVVGACPDLLRSSLADGACRHQTGS